MGTWGGGRTEIITYAIPTVHGAGAAAGPVWQGRERGWGQSWGPTRWARGRSRGPSFPTSLTSPLGLSPAASVLPAAAMEAVSGLKCFEGSCCTSLRAFQWHEQAPRHLCLGRRQVQAFRALQQLLPPKSTSWCTRRHPPGQEVSKADLPPLSVQQQGPCQLPAPSLCSSFPLFGLIPRLQRKATETLLQ